MAIIRIGALTVIGEAISIIDSKIAIDGEVITEAQADKALRAPGPIRVEVVDGVLSSIVSNTDVNLTGPVIGTIALGGK